MAEDYYALLGVEPDAPQERIDAAFLGFSRSHAADRTTIDPTAAHHFQRVESAYRILSDPEARATYDRFAGHGSPAPAPAIEETAEAPVAEAGQETPDDDADPETPVKAGYEWSFGRAAGVLLILYGLYVLYTGKVERYPNESANGLSRHYGYMGMILEPALRVFGHNPSREVETGVWAKLDGLLELLIGAMFLIAPPTWDEFVGSLFRRDRP